MKRSWTTLASRLGWYLAGRHQTLRARLSGKAFYCKALAGESSYNISVNSDLSLSCNCADYDGQGHFGDLKHQTIHEAFAGPRAVAMRMALAGGILPILRCGRCPELAMVSISQAQELSHRWHLPGGVMVEGNGTCNLSCRSCPREEVMARRPQTTIPDDEMRRLAGMLRDAGVASIAFFNLGEPFLAANVCRQLNILHERCPSAKITISTNGILLDSDDKRRAAMLCDRIDFSIDGISQDVASRYQRHTQFERAVENMRKLLQLRRELGLKKPRILWKYVLFRWNDRPAHIQGAIELARDVGADEILFWRTWSPFYGVSWRSLLGRLHHIGDSFPSGRRVVFNPPD